MNQSDLCQHFASLHVKGDPVVLFNMWDAGSAKVVAKAGAKALGTGSWSVAAAQGYADGEAIPMDLVETIIKRICETVSVPVTLDFEGAYDDNPEVGAKNVMRMIDAGICGINFEDQVVGGQGLHDVEVQSLRIAAIRAASDTKSVPLVINARTDIFLKASSAEEHASLVEDAVTRGKAYEAAGASSFFVPGLMDDALIADICKRTALPVNIMMKKGVSSTAKLAELGVARVSYGPSPYAQLMKQLSGNATEVYDAIR